MSDCKNHHRPLAEGYGRWSLACFSSGWLDSMSKFQHHPDLKPLTTWGQLLFFISCTSYYFFIFLFLIKISFTSLIWWQESLPKLSNLRFMSESSIVGHVFILIIIHKKHIRRYKCLQAIRFDNCSIEWPAMGQSRMSMVFPPIVINQTNCKRANWTKKSS